MSKWTAIFTAVCAILIVVVARWGYLRIEQYQKDLIQVGYDKGYNYIKDIHEIQQQIIDAGITEVEVEGEIVPILVDNEWGVRTETGLDLAVCEQYASRWDYLYEKGGEE